MRRSDATSSGAMWYAILAAWGAATALLAWRFAPHLGPTPVGVVYLFLLAALSYFVLTGVFNVVVNATSHLLRGRGPAAGFRGAPKVAMLYCTYNDFDRASADTLLSLTYGNLEIWMLDDSTKAEERAQVDAFVRDASGVASVRLLRREDRRGFKAGAINAALRELDEDVAFVAIVDADERLVPDFVQGCLRHFDEDVAFVQANHRCYNEGRNWFTRHLGVGVDLHWRHYQPYRNRFGTVNMLGHGALVRRDVLERVGGFPEVTCEDLAFTVAAKIEGYRGAFASDVVCGETFPEDFAAMRKRHLRWSWATVEFLRNDLGRILRSRMRLHEKLDLLLPSLNLPAVYILVAFLLTAQAVHWAGWVLSPFNDPAVLALAAFASLAPLAMFADLAGRPLFALKAVAINTIAYVALFPVSMVGVFRGLTSPAQFLVTPKGTVGHLRLRSAVREARAEVLVGSALLVAGYLSLGVWGLASPLAWSAIGVPALMVASRRSLLEGRPGRGSRGAADRSRPVGKPTLPPRPIEVRR